MKPKSAIEVRQIPIPPEIQKAIEEGLKQGREEARRAQAIIVGVLTLAFAFYACFVAYLILMVAR